LAIATKSRWQNTESNEMEKYCVMNVINYAVVACLMTIYDDILKFIYSNIDLNVSGDDD
jgi:hypothetical protein